MKPTCKLCETKHRTWDEHTIGSALDKVQALGAGVLRNSVTKRTPVTKPVLSDGAEDDGGSRIGSNPPLPQARIGHDSSASSPSAGRPKKHKSNAERQRAYGERK